VGVTEYRFLDNNAGSQKPGSFSSRQQTHQDELLSTGGTQSSRAESFDVWLDVLDLVGFDEAFTLHQIPIAVPESCSPRPALNSALGFSLAGERP
jgi:hypothetical protein